MGVPALPPPRGRQTSDHSLDAEQDIATAASTVTSAVGATSMVTASATVEYDSLSRRAQMIIPMDRNASNASNESLSASYVKNMYDSVMRQCGAIIAEVVREKPELEILITDALDAPFIVRGCCMMDGGSSGRTMATGWIIFLEATLSHIQRNE